MVLRLPLLGASTRPGPALWWIVASAAASLALVHAVPGLRDLFRFSEVRAAEVLLGIGAGAASFVWLELLNVVRMRSLKKADP